MDKLKPVFDQIRADDGLRQRTLTYVQQHRRQPRRFYGLAAAATCILVLLLGGWLYYTPTARISIDLDVPLTLEVNRFDRVISASGSGSQAILQGLELTHLTYSDAMDQILSSTTVTEQLSNGEIMAVSVIAPEGDQSARLLSKAKACAQDRENAQCYYAEPDTAQEAQSMGLPLGKYRVFLELQALDPSITADDIRDLTMRQIRELIDALSQTDPLPTEPIVDPTPEPTSTPTEVPTSPGHHGQGNGNGQGSGNGQGNGQGNGNGHGKQ